MRNLVLTALLLASGCGTIIGTEERGICPYRGVDEDCKRISRDFHDGGFLFVLDLPLSFAVDTVMLPISIPCKGMYK